VTADGKLSWLEVECLGACCNAPMAQINFDYYEDLTPENFRKLLDDLRHGRPTKPGPQIDRSCSEPVGGGETLKDASLYDGSVIGAGDWQKRIAKQREEAAIKIASEKAAAEAKAKAEAEAAAVTGKAGPTDTKTAPAPEAAAPARPKPSEPGQPASAAQDTPSATGKAIKDADRPAPAATETKPELLTAARGGKGDDLELIWGVGPKLAVMLNEMGIWHYDQVAAWTPAELAWVDARLTGFKGRAVRDDWISQAKKLATGWRPDGKLGDKPVK
jgi:NADH-quinone oxidoreductase subunit E